MRVFDPVRPARRRIAAAALASVLLCASAAPAAPRTYEVDPNHLFVTFMIRHAGLARIIGRFMRGEGRFVYDAETGTVDSGTVTIYSKSVFTGHYRRDKVLRSSDYLDVANYPEIVFEISGFEATGNGSGQLSGQLSMRGETHPVTFDATVNRVVRPDPGSDTPFLIGVSARMTIARSRWGMSPNAAQLADGVELIVEVEARAPSN